MNLAFGIAMFFFGLFGFISIIGIFWALYKKKPKRIWIISVLANVFLFIGSVVLYNYQLTPEEKNAIVAQREQRKTEQETQKKIDQPQVNGQEKQGIAPETKSQESILTSIASKNLGKNFKKIEVKDFVDDSTKKIVLVHYNGSGGYDSTMAKKSMLIQTADLFKELFAAGIAIHEITAFIYTDMKNSNGLHESLAMKCQLNGSTAAGISWNNINKTKFDQNLDYIWTAPGLTD